MTHIVTDGEVLIVDRKLYRGYIRPLEKTKIKKVRVNENTWRVMAFTGEVPLCQLAEELFSREDASDPLVKQMYLGIDSRLNDLEQLQGMIIEFRYDKETKAVTISLNIAYGIVTVENISFRKNGILALGIERDKVESVYNVVKTIAERKGMSIKNLLFDADHMYVKGDEIEEVIRLAMRDTDFDQSGREIDRVDIAEVSGNILRFFEGEGE